MKNYKNNMEIMEPNFYTDNPNHWFAGFDPYFPVAIIENLQIQNESDFQFILGITGTDPFMFGEKFGSKWFNSKLVIITSITSLYEVWRSLDDKIRIRHNFWELGRRIDLHLRANEPEENDTHYFFHYNQDNMQ
jgi:hypothetical protein